MVSTYRISQLADRVGTPATTLRFYEKLGLLPSQRTAAGNRIYDDAALGHLQELPARDGPCDPDCDFLHGHGHREPIPAGLTAVPTHRDPHAFDPAPVACSLTAGQYGARIQDWRTLLDGARREPLPDGGMRVRLPIARASQLTQLGLAEQQCCPFFTFRLTFAGDHVELEAHAPDGAEPLVADLFGEQVCSC